MNENKKYSQINALILTSISVFLAVSMILEQAITNFSFDGYPTFVVFALVIIFLIFSLVSFLYVCIKTNIIPFLKGKPLGRDLRVLASFAPLYALAVLGIYSTWSDVFILNGGLFFTIVTQMIALTVAWVIFDKYRLLSKFKNISIFGYIVIVVSKIISLFGIPFLGTVLFLIFIGLFIGIFIVKLLGFDTGTYDIEGYYNKLVKTKWIYDLFGKSMFYDLNMCFALLEKGEFKDALDVLNKIDTDSKHLKKHRLSYYWYICTCLLELEDFENANKYFERYKEVQKEDLMDELIPQVVELRERWFNYKTKECEENLTKYIEILKELQNPSMKSNTIALNLYTGIYEKEYGDTEKAVGYFKRVLKESNHPRIRQIAEKNLSGLPKPDEAILEFKTGPIQKPVIKNNSYLKQLFFYVMIFIIIMALVFLSKMANG